VYKEIQTMIDDETTKALKFQILFWIIWQVLFHLLKHFTNPDEYRKTAPLLLLVWMLSSSLLTIKIELIEFHHSSKIANSTKDPINELKLYFKWGMTGVFFLFAFSMMFLILSGSDDFKPQGMMWNWGCMYYVTSYGIAKWNIFSLFLVGTPFPPNGTLMVIPNTVRTALFLVVLIWLVINTFRKSIQTSNDNTAVSNDCSSVWGKLCSFLLYSFLWASAASSIVHGFEGTKEEEIEALWIICFMLYAHTRGIDMHNVMIVYCFTATSILCNNHDGNPMTLLEWCSSLWISVALVCSLLHCWSRSWDEAAERNDKKECAEDDFQHDYEPLAT
jgi:hypothetical protein